MFVGKGDYLNQIDTQKGSNGKQNLNRKLRITPIRLLIYEREIMIIRFTLEAVGKIKWVN